MTGPAHIPWQDQRWQELLHGYNVWVHVEHREGTGVLDRACQSLTQHAPRSSNLAALIMHVTRMLRALIPPELIASSSTTIPAADGVTAFSNRIALVGKARATAGSLNLLRILIHAVISSPASSKPPPDSKGGDQDAFLKECLRYRSRDSNQVQDEALDLLEALLYFIQQCNNMTVGLDSSHIPPEVYDTLTLVLELLFVLLSTQLYRPMQSSFQRLHGGVGSGYFWEVLMAQARRQVEMVRGDKTMKPSWTPSGLLVACLEWQMSRPSAPARSIQQHASQLANQVVAAKGEKPGADGMYENHLIVTACSTPTTTVSVGETTKDLVTTQQHRHHGVSATAILDATKGVLVLSSSIILLPFRLMSLAIGLWKAGGKEYDQMHKKHLQSSLKHSNRTKDVLWLTESPVADLASCLLLLLINNERAGNNPFRDDMAGLTDNRWDDGVILDSNGLPDLPQLTNDETAPLVTAAPPPPPPPRKESSESDSLSVDFEGMFGAFGTTAHTEVGALLLYTVMQSSPNFAEAIAVRSDLDTIVLPMLRTLYFASSLRFYAAQDYRSKTSDSVDGSKKLSIRNCPFRSQSQLYVLVILLLLLSQDSSFGADAFRRVMVQSVPWYKERNLKAISLGSIIVLTILRSLTFNLSRLMDPFLLSNCCAVLMNLSPSIVELHEYAAMRLIGVTVSCMKRYTELIEENPDDDEEDLTTPTAMHGEVSRTLLQLTKHCLSFKNLDRNLHLIYALIYHQVDFRKVVSAKGT